MTRNETQNDSLKRSVQKQPDERLELQHTEGQGIWI